VAVFNKFNIFVADVNNGVHNLGSNALKLALSNTLPVASNTLFANITEIGAGNGYSAGGAAITITSSAQVAGVYRLIGNNVVFTASGGTIGPFRYLILYNSTPVSPLKPLIGWYDYGSAVTLNSGDAFTHAFDGTNGILSDT